MFWIKLFLAYYRTFGIFLIRAGIREQVLVGSISSNVQNDLEGSLIIKKGRDLHMGIFVSFHQKLVVYYILDYFGILFILDLNFVLREFILWNQRLF